jgi:hypothetical protein
MWHRELPAPPTTKRATIMAPSDDRYFPTFSAFLDTVHAARHDEYALKPAARAEKSDQFESMREHILDLYDGVEVQHSFVDVNGQVFDCVPIEAQPSLRGSLEGPASPPGDLPSVSDAGPGSAEQIQPQLSSGRLDKYGHSMSCPPGTIAVRRVTLDELTRNEDLSDFFRKVPVGVGRHPRLSPKPTIAPNVHKWAHARQDVANLGGHSVLNVWDPAVGSQVFSLSQHWYAGGSPVQTAECGWQVYPGKYNTTQPVLFIYWTADGYQSTGNYNLDAPAFVQTNHNWAIGGTLSPSSISGGQQYDIEMSFYLYQGNWWLYLGGGAAANAVGYYPASLYHGGQMASNATSIDYGGEVVDTTAWPPMGSGAFANAGWQRAAYQRDITYFGTGGGGVQASLAASQPSANCFTSEVNHAAAPWNEYVFFGGPGGMGCS